MKKLKLLMLASLMLTSILPLPLQGANVEPVTTPAPVPAESQEVKLITARIAEIKAMDKSKLTAAEKKQLRQELRLMKNNKKAISGGVYLSAGTVIIILLLLILLL